jgi:hypothetical protein
MKSYLVGIEFRAMTQAVRGPLRKQILRAEGGAARCAALGLSRLGSSDRIELMPTSRRAQPERGRDMRRNGQGR